MKKDAHKLFAEASLALGSLTTELVDTQKALETEKQAFTALNVLVTEKSRELTRAAERERGLHQVINELHEQERKRGEARARTLGFTGDYVTATAAKNYRRFARIVTVRLPELQIANHCSEEILHTSAVERRSFVEHVARDMSYAMARAIDKALVEAVAADAGSLTIKDWPSRGTATRFDLDRARGLYDRDRDGDF